MLEISRRLTTTRWLWLSPHLPTLPASSTRRHSVREEFPLPTLTIWRCCDRYLPSVSEFLSLEAGLPSMSPTSDVGHFAPLRPMSHRCCKMIFGSFFEERSSG